MASEDNLRVELKTQNSSSNLSVTAEQSQSESLGTVFHKLRATITTEDDIIASIMDAVGEFGTYQRGLIALSFLPNLLTCFFIFIEVTLFSDQKAYCNTSWILAVGPNLSEDEQLNLTLPRDANGSFLTCLMYLPVNWDLDSIIQFGLNETQSCNDGWIYPKSKTRSLINEFDLVCGKEFNMEDQLTVFLAGIIMGSLVFGFISDRFGRYPALLLSIMGMMIFGFGSAFVSTFQQYQIYRFMVSQALVGYSISSISLVIEWLTGEHRAHGIVLDHCFYAFGFLFLVGLSYTFAHWRLLFLVGGAPAFFLIPYIWILPESPRWLMAKGKMEKAKQVLCYAASVNNREIPLCLLNQVPREPVTDASLLDFYNNRQLFKATLVMACVWFSNGYSLMMLGSAFRDFGVNVYSSQIIPGILGVPARLCTLFLLEQIGRKWSLAVTHFQGTLMTLLILNFSSELKSTKVLMILLGEFSQLSSFIVLCIYTSELLPTVVRSTGLGLVSLAWSAGGILFLTLISQSVSSLPVVVCGLLAICALFLCSMLPETRGMPIVDSLDHYLLKTRDTNNELVSENLSCNDGTEEKEENTGLKAMMPNLKPESLDTKSLQAKEETAGRPDD
ncbi:solute carrier family 22 member 14-like [Rhynchonycteris naso]